MKKTLSLIITLVTAMTMVLAGAFSAYAAASPHYRPDPTPRTGLRIDYYDVQHVIMDPANSELMPGYMEQLKRINPAAYEREKELVDSGWSSVRIYKGHRSDGIKDALILTEYPERVTIIADSSRNEMNLAYAEVTRAEGHMEKILPQIASIAAQKGFAIEDCSVERLFDLTYYLINPDYVYSRDYRRVHMELNDDSIEDKFVCLLHRNEGVWTVVENAKVIGSTLTFETAALSPFAIVVADIGTAFDSDGKQSPKTGDNTLIWAATAIGGLMLLLGAGYVLIRKKNV